MKAVCRFKRRKQSNAKYCACLAMTVCTGFGAVFGDVFCTGFGAIFCAVSFSGQLPASAQSGRANSASELPIPASTTISKTQSTPFTVVPDKPPVDWSSDRLLALAACYKNMGSPERAKGALRLAIKNDKAGKAKKEAQMLLDSELPKYPVAPEANEINNRAFDHYCHKDYGLAIKTLNQCVAKYPHFETPLNTLSTIYLLLKKPQLARECARKALAINSQCSNAWTNLANSYLMEGDYKNARLHCVHALQCYPGNGNASDMLKYLSRKRS